VREASLSNWPYSFTRKRMQSHRLGGFSSGLWLLLQNGAPRGGTGIKIGAYKESLCDTYPVLVPTSKL